MLKWDFSLQELETEFTDVDTDAENVVEPKENKF